VKESPGHTSDGIILISFEDRLIFTGDTIFNRSIGRTDLGGDYDTLMNSIRNKIMNGAGITDDFKIYPGHMSPSSVGNERKFNPFNEDFL
jgi:glyoxylase-like metal-dependent hydrolase (beta-lactamase superfamily II)